MKKIRNTKTGQDTSIINGLLYFEDALQCPVDSPQLEEIISDGYTNTIRLISLSANWYETVHIAIGATIKDDINFQMTLRREVRSERGYWYAYRRVLGKLHKRFVGQDSDITEKRLLEVAHKMPSL